MAIVSMQLDPNAQSYTDAEIVAKINTASTQITRASSVSSTARPIVSGEITTTHISSTAGILGSQLSSTAAQTNLNAMTDTTREYIKTNPVTGEFKVTALQRDATGKLDVEYDNVAVS